MNVVTFDILKRKLKDAPQSVLERVIGYVDAILEHPVTQKQPNTLTDQQQKILDQQINLDKSSYTDADVLYTKLKNKYEI